MKSSVLDLMNHGGGTLWLIVGFSVIAVGVAVERAVAQWQFTSRARQLADTVGRCLGRGAVGEARSACERSKSPLADVFLVGYERHGRVAPERVVTAVHRERQRVNQDLRQRLWILGTIGALAPFVGLAGTVIGIMDAMSGWEGQDEVKFSMVAGPISQALVATAAGIIVAIESVILFNFFSQRSNRIATELKLLTDEFLEQLLEQRAEPATTTAKTKGDKDGSDGDRNAA